jgi:metal-responsive CopG/Arc/MetJ family transcriptional regulator
MAKITEASIRFKVSMSHELYRYLDEWSENSGCSMSEIATRAFSLYKACREASEAGKKIWIVSADGSHETEIGGF